MEIALKENFYKTLSFISNSLSNSNIEWFVIGKTNLYLQGLDLNPSKIGILIHSEDLDSFTKTFKDYISSPIIDLTNGEAKEFFIDIFDIKVQVCAEYSNGTYWKVKKDIVDIPVNDITVQGFSLEAEAEAYNILGDIATEIQIMKYIENKKAIKAS